MLNDKKRHDKNNHQKSPSANADGKAKSYDVIIIGGGAAGMSAALWCDELQLKTLLLEETDKPGGQLFRIYNPIKNHLGADAKNGLELQKLFFKQISQRGFARRMQSKVCEVEVQKKYVVLENGEKINWRFLIAATGVSRRKLNVEGEAEFKNRGIIESGKRDAKSLKNKSAAIIGGGDAALENALILTETAAAVTVIHRSRNFAARSEFTEKAHQNQRVKFLTEMVVTKFCGKERLEFIELKNIKTGKVLTLPTEAVLVRIGVEPNTEIFRGNVDLDDQGYIKVNENGETNAKNVFAIGDVANPAAPTISGAVGTGATAAKIIFSKFKEK